MSVLRLLLLVSLAMTIAGGCQRASSEVELRPEESQHNEHEQGNHQQDQDEASGDSLESQLAEIKSLDQSIAKILKSETPGEAHSLLHEIAYALQTLQASVKEQAHPEQESIHQTIENLLDYFAEIDAIFHGGEGATYEEMATKINAAFEQLSQLLKTAQ